MSSWHWRENHPAGLTLPVFFFHSASAFSFPYDGGNSIVSAEFICAVVLFPPYLFSLHMWNQINRTALELSQICNFSVANGRWDVNLRIWKNHRLGGCQSVAQLDFYTFFRELLRQILFLYFPNRERPQCQVNHQIIHYIFVH